MELSQVIIKPLSTEKSVKLAEVKQFAFLVHKDACKPEITRAIQEFYGEKPLSCRVLPTKEKSNSRRLKKRAGKKAILTFAANSKFDQHKIK